MAAQPKSFERKQQAAARPIWLEALAGIDWLALRSSPVYYGLGIPRGDRSAVVAVPGFMGTDLYLQEMYWWLRRVGYRPYLSRIGRNADCLDILVERLSETIEKACDKTGGKVHLIGHSLGGVLARSAAMIFPQRVASVITLGSPFRGIRSHPMVLQMGEFVRQRITRARDQGRPPACYTGFCSCDAVSALQIPWPESVRETAIYTKSDGIVDWRVCVHDDPAKDFEVVGTHSGLAFNPSVYYLIATRLAAAGAE
jgi:triacylglycerol lipase